MKTYPFNAEWRKFEAVECHVLLDASFVPRLAHRVIQHGVLRLTWLRQQGGGGAKQQVKKLIEPEVSQ